MRTLLIATLLAAVTSATALHAQSEAAADLQPGARVRVAVPVRSGDRIITATRGWTVGTIQSIDREFIVLRVQRPEGQTEEQIPFDVITGLEVSRGLVSGEDAQRRGAIRGAKIGTALGVALSTFGFLISQRGGGRGPGLGTPDDCTDICSVLAPTAESALRNVFVGGGLGALAGTFFGERARETWEPIAKPRVDLRSRPGGGTAVSLSFAL